MKYRDFIKILRSHGFEKLRQGATSHSIYRGTVTGKVQQVVVSGTGGKDIMPKTLASMVRQSGLSKKLFR